MTIKAVKNMENINELCCYDIDSGSYFFKEKNAITDEKEFEFDVGFFVKVKHEIYGVCSSLNGPVLFKNSERFALKKCNFNLVHEHLDKKMASFTLTIETKIIFKVIYNLPLYIDLDVWSSEADVDFFQWIYNICKNDVTKERFLNYYTR